MLRLFDWECSACKEQHENLAEIPHGKLPRSVTFECPYCEETVRQRRLISLPAPYMGEKNLSPIVKGGSFDTVGHRKLPDLPDLPGAKEHSAKTQAALRALPPNATQGDRQATILKAGKDAPRASDYMALFNKPEYKEAESARKQVAKQNADKKKRHRALTRGENVNFRRDKALGDPKMSS